MNFRFLVLLCLTLTFSCISETSEQNTKPKAIDKQENAFLLKDGKPVSFKPYANEQIIVTKNHEKESILRYAKLKDCIDFYCSNTFGKSKIHRRSNNGKYFIEYDPVSSINSLYLASEIDQAIASLKLEANNPEFSIETIPLEDEAGILLTDGIYGFTKYGLNDAQLVKEFQIKFNTEWQHEKFIVLNAQNKLLVFKRNLKEQKALVDYYSLDNGKLIDTKVINNKYKRLNYLSSQKLLAFHHLNGLMVKDELCQKTICEIPQQLINETFTVNHNDQQTKGLIRTKQGFTAYSHSPQQLDTIKYTLSENSFAHQFFNTKKYTGVLYFEKDMSASDFQISEQGLIVFSKETNAISKVILSIEGLASISFDIDEALILEINKLHHTVLLHKL